MSTLTTGAPMRCLLSFFFHDTATPEIYTLSLHDALPICLGRRLHPVLQCGDGRHAPRRLQEDRSGRLRDGARRARRLLALLPLAPRIVAGTIVGVRLLVSEPRTDRRHAGAAVPQRPPRLRADRGVKRRTFGAPFGLEREDHSALALVAIRNLQLGGDRIRVGSGAGLLPESLLSREFEELRDKREQVKALFGVSARIAAYA